MLFPLVNEKTTPEKTTDALRDRLFDLRKRGFNRLYQGGKVFEFSTPESLLDVDFSKPVFILVDRLAITPDIRQRLVDAVEICYRESGEALFEPAGGGADAALQRKVRLQAVRQRPSPSRSRACSASTAPSARASAARDSATPSTTTWIW